MGEMSMDEMKSRAERVADEAAAECRRRGGTVKECESEWRCWFDEEMRVEQSIRSATRVHPQLKTRAATVK